nr:hypothetical protein [Chelatococcus sp. YT9]
MAGSQGPNVIKLGGEGDVILVTGDVDDVVYTGAGNDYVRTGKGDDVISPGAGRNFVETGTGHDVVVIARAEHSVLPSVKEKMLTTITDFDPANDILRFAFLREGRLLDHDRTLTLEQEVATSNATTLEDAAATMRAHMNTNEVAALHWDGITYVLVDNAEQTTVRLHGVVDIQPDSITFG